MKLRVTYFFSPPILIALKINCKLSTQKFIIFFIISTKENNYILSVVEDSKVLGKIQHPIRAELSHLKKAFKFNSEGHY